MRRRAFIGLSVLLAVGIALIGDFPTRASASIPSLSGFTGITVFESTSNNPTPHFFAANNLWLTTVRSLPLGPQNRDFQGTQNESYDVFFSDPDGTRNAKGDCVTVRGQYPVSPNAGGFNIAQINLNFSSGPPVPLTVIGSFAPGVGYVLGSQAKAVDGNINTYTSFGGATGQHFMALTLCLPLQPPCCDMLKEQPFLNPVLNQSVKTFTITNPLKSQICWIDVKFTPVPASYSGGGPGALGGIVVDTVQQPSGLFTFPYTRIPKVGNLVSGNTAGAKDTVIFNLGVNWSIGWQGTVHFTVHHCDGTTCELDSKLWQATAPATGSGPGVVPGSVTEVGSWTIGTLALRAPRRDVAYLAFATVDPKERLLTDAGTSSGPVRKGGVATVNVAPLGLRSNSVLYAISRPSGGKDSFTLELALRRAQGKKGSSQLRWVTFNSDAKPLTTGVISLGGSK